MNNLKSFFKFINQMSSLYVPAYHRGYFWDVDICKNFLKNFLHSPIGLDFGVIIYQKNDDRGNFILIDGYQRLLTILVFVQALISSGRLEVSAKNQPANFLVYKSSDNETIFKLKINNNDKNDIEYILKNKFDDYIFNNENLRKNYDYFVEALKNDKTPILEFLNNFSKIKINNILVDDTHREDELYFEVNNSFTQIDLIRNYVYKELKTKQILHIFQTYWLGMEKDLGNLFEGFLIDYLTIQNNGVIPFPDMLFPAFNAFFFKISRFKSLEEMIKHIYRYACFYKKIVNSDINDKELQQRLCVINSCEAKDTYPYLMEVFEDYEFAHINKHMLVDILDTIVSFVEQRRNEKSGLKEFNFADLSKNINRMLALKDYTPKVVKYDVKDAKESHQRITINDLIMR